MKAKNVLYLQGKYDTYKGSTHSVRLYPVIICGEENMILIKDRHLKFCK